MIIEPNALVSHPQWGQGTVRFVEADGIANVRFADGSKDVDSADLSVLADLDAKIAAGQSDAPLEVISRAQAAAIRSTNARWGIFARSKIDLLPHQLWVCHRVNATWPARWLVADDVGLGKTIEAGLVAMSQIARGQVKRILVLCPAPLVTQWQERMREMFGIRLLPYFGAMDAHDGTFWDDHDAIVASLDTIKMDASGRKTRILQAAPFDLLIVDEAHRLGSGPRETTQAYRLVKALMDGRKIASALFFTGTPHRGHDWGFYALLQLLHPQWFDPKQPAKNQIQHLPKALIRNNKALVTDMAGNKLFRSPLVASETYEYSPAEARFYARLTDFISSGQMYAARQDEKEGRAIMLVLIAMQKLASSSVAAIAGAINTRLKNLGQISDEARQLQRQLERAQFEDDDDQIGELEAQLVGAQSRLSLVEGEETALKTLKNDAEAVGEETKISRIMELVETRFKGRSVLFFTEYKATQRLLLQALLAKYGEDCASFINGDNALSDVAMPSGRVSDLSSNRAEAAEMFNRGEIRFLISTEAGGEGIDLQGACHCLIHVDLPWNPMRLHQRVGRLNRYGQTERVEVVSLRNPDTVESLVWEHLNAKLTRIAGNLNAAMDDPEDLLQLVLGMNTGINWNQLYSGALGIKREKLGDWFDAQTGQLGGQSTLEAVQTLVGEASRFDFGRDAQALPRVDLPDLAPFLDGALAINGKRLMERGFSTPESWKRNPRWGTFLPDSYEGISFDRRDKTLDKAGQKLMGAGHNALEAALDEALAREASFAVLPAEIGGQNLAVFRVFDRLSQTTTQNFLLGVWGENWEVLEDWQTLLKLNQWSGKRALRLIDAPLRPNQDATKWLENARQQGENALSKFQWGFQKPALELWLAMLIYH